jgi:hypothetical protein
MDRLSLTILEFIRERPRSRSSEIEIKGYSAQGVSDAIDHLIQSGKLRGVDATHMQSECKEWIELSITHLGGAGLDEAKRAPVRKFIQNEWKWLATTAIAVLALLIAILKK